MNDCQVNDEVRRVVRHSCSVWRRGGAVPVSVYHSPVKVNSHQPWIKHQWPWRSAARNWNLSSERSCSVEIEWENICLSSSASLSLFPTSYSFSSHRIHIFNQLWRIIQRCSILTASLPWLKPLSLWVSATSLCRDWPDHSRWLSRWEGPIRNRTPLTTTWPWPCRVDRTLPGDGNSI